MAWDKPPLLEKTPTCPDRVIWHGETPQVIQKLVEWRNYRRRSRMGKNMRPAHLHWAQQRGSWGVGRFYFRVCVVDGRILELYYDRAAQGSDRRKGSWFLIQELL